MTSATLISRAGTGRGERVRPAVLAVFFAGIAACLPAAYATVLIWMIVELRRGDRRPPDPAASAKPAVTAP